MKGIAILAMALLMTSLFTGFALAETSNGQEVDAVSANSIKVGVKLAPSSATGNAVARKKQMPVSVGAARAVSPASVVKATPSITQIRVEEAYSEVTVKAKESWPGKKEFGLATAVSGPGNAVNARGITKQIQIMTVSQSYVNDDGSEQVEVSEGTIVVADVVYGLELRNIEANRKMFSIMQSGVQVGSLDVVESTGLMTGTIDLNGETSNVEITTEENPVKLEGVSADALGKPVKESVVAKIASWFKGLFG